MVNKNYKKRELIKNMLLNGNTYKEISIKLHCSETTINLVQKELSNENNLNRIIEKAKKDCWSLTKSEFYILRNAFYDTMNSEGINLDNQDLAYAWNNFNPYFAVDDDRNDNIHMLKDKYNYNWDYYRETKKNSMYHRLQPIGKFKSEIEKELEKEKAIDNLPKISKEDIELLKSLLVKIRRDKRDEDNSNE